MKIMFSYLKQNNAKMKGYSSLKLFREKSDL